MKIGCLLIAGPHIDISIYHSCLDSSIHLIDTGKRLQVFFFQIITRFKDDIADKEQFVFPVIKGNQIFVKGKKDIVERVTLWVFIGNILP